MLIRHAVLAFSAAGLVLYLASPAEAAAKGKQHKRTAYHTVGQRQAVAPKSVYQGGVLAGPLYNGQDYLGDDPDPNIRAYLLKDMSRYGGFN